MSNENSNLRVGSAGAGLLVGDKLIAGKEFDWSKLYANLSYVWPNGGTTDSFPVIIANLSSDPVLLHRDGETEEVAPGKIDWYTIGGQGKLLMKFLYLMKMLMAMVPANELFNFIPQCMQRVRVLITVLLIIKLWIRMN
jgi:hypothetical protein